MRPCPPTPYGPPGLQPGSCTEAVNWTERTCLGSPGCGGFAPTRRPTTEITQTVKTEPIPRRLMCEVAPAPFGSDRGPEPDRRLGACSPAPPLRHPRGGPLARCPCPVAARPLPSLPPGRGLDGAAGRSWFLFRPSHHPLVAFLQETGDLVGLRRRPDSANTAAGAKRWIPEIIQRRADLIKTDSVEGPQGALKSPSLPRARCPYDA